jgi:MFS family permease
MVVSDDIAVASVYKSRELLQMIVLRFLVGVGMAFFFGPSVTLISKYLGKGSEGFGIGLLNSAQALGAIIGIFGWVVVAQLTGWRISLLLSGTLGILTALFLAFALARTKRRFNGKKGEEDLTVSRMSVGTFYCIN